MSKKYLLLQLREEDKGLLLINFDTRELSREIHKVMYILLNRIIEDNREEIVSKISRFTKYYKRKEEVLEINNNSCISIELENINENYYTINILEIFTLSVDIIIETVRKGLSIDSIISILEVI